MGPISTGLGEIYSSPSRARVSRPWSGGRSSTGTIAPRLRAVPGVTEVNVWGGLPKQYQVVVDPARLVALRPVPEAGVRGRRARDAATRAAATSSATASSTSIRGEGLVGSTGDIEKIVLKAGPEGTPVTVGNVAQVREGAMLRIGAATRDGEGETVIGMALMLAGENALEVAGRVRRAVEELAAVAPEGRQRSSPTTTARSSSGA